MKQSKISGLLRRDEVQCGLIQPIPGNEALAQVRGIL